MKLNERQAAMLLVMEAIEVPVVVTYYAPWPVSTATLKALAGRGLVELKNSHFWHLTEAGKAKCQEYEQLVVPQLFGTGLSAICDWIERNKWKPTLTTGMRI